MTDPTANTAQRVDVEELLIALINHAYDDGDADMPCMSEQTKQARDALLLQVAELRTSRDAYKHDAEALLQITNGARGALEAAERAREEARGLLREVIDEFAGVGCYPCTGSMAPFEDMAGRIASFLAANG